MKKLISKGFVTGILKEEVYFRPANGIGEQCYGKTQLKSEMVCLIFMIEKESHNEPEELLLNEHSNSSGV